MEGQKEWLSDGSEGTSTKIEMESVKGLDAEMKLGFSDSKFSLEAERQLCDGDWKAEAELEADFKPAKSEWEMQPKIKFASPAMSGAKLFCNLALTHGSADPSAWELHKKVNICYDGEYHFGFSVKHDMSKLGPVFIQLAQTPKGKEQTNYLRVSKDDKIVSVGTSYKYSKGYPVACPTWHAWEATYNG